MISTFVQYLQFMDEKYSEKTAFQWVDPESEQLICVPFRDYVRDIHRFANYLTAAVPEIRGQHIGILAEKSYDYIVCLFGIIAAGAAAVPLNPMKSADSLLEEITFSDVAYLFQDGIYTAQEDLGSQFTGIALPISAYRNFDVSEDAAGAIDPDAAALMLFTSGTTGKSKCVVLAVKSLLATLNTQIQQYLDKINLLVKSGVTIEQLSQMPTPKFLHLLPLYHASGISALLSFPVLGVQTNLCLYMRNVYSDLQRMPSTMTSVVPVVFESFYKDLLNGKRNRLGSLAEIICGSATINPEILALFKENGFTLAQGYGMTESFAAGTIIIYEDLSRIKSIGKPSPGCEIKIISDEICIRSKSLMSGYYKDPEATAEVLQDGWLHTGDLGYMDEDGFIYLAGRKKNLIILSSGENVSPEELEDLVSKNADVKEIVVKEKNGKICAEVFCEADKQEEIRSFITEVNRSLAMYKRMTLVEFRTEPFPRTASGKIKRQE